MVELDPFEHTVSEADAGDVFFHRAELPHLILVQPFGLPFFMVDLNGPSMTTDAQDPPRTPMQAVGDIKLGFVREVFL